MKMMKMMKMSKVSKMSKIAKIKKTKELKKPVFTLKGRTEGANDRRNAHAHFALNSNGRRSSVSMMFWDPSIQ